jgi:hypothetical protein
LLVACRTQPPFPGSEVMGAFLFQAEPLSNTCDRYAGDFPPDGGPQAALQFSGTFSRNPGTPDVWFSFAGTAWDAGFDGQYAWVAMTGNRQFAACTGCGSVPLTETLRVALLSVSQSNEAGGHCPNDPLDGGVPAPTDGGANDAGDIRAPGSTPLGFDVLLACGTLTDTLDPDAGCGCGPDAGPDAGTDGGAVDTGACAWQYAVTGVRH